MMKTYKRVQFGAGCFWHVEHALAQLPGVVQARSGYAGGHDPEPSYRKVCNEQTGHSEVVEVYYDPQQTNLKDLCHYFWTIHDPTTPNRQGVDVGTQYRSAIYVDDADDFEVVQESRAAAQKNFTQPIVTEIRMGVTFYPAEDYHQKYYEKNPHLLGTCGI